jgi:type VI secretion system (T6SS) effector TldE1-like protein
MSLISAGIAALAIGAFLKSQVPISPGMHVASLETYPASDLEERESSPELPAAPRDTFDQRFAGATASPGSPPARTAERKEEEGPDNKLLPPPARAAAHPAVADSAPQVAPVTSSPLAGAPKKRIRAADLSTDSSSSPDVDSRTAIYDIAAHTVYLPDGHRLEAHSGLGGYMDDARYINVKGRGATPPNIYDLALRERSFHGVRAIRLVPVDDRKMFGRDGMLAHSYMLGPNGQSNGCVSFSDYPAFLNAFLRGEVNRLVVVEHLATVPDPKTASGWIPGAIKDLFGFRRS